MLCLVVNETIYRVLGTGKNCTGKNGTEKSGTRLTTYAEQTAPLQNCKREK